MRLLWPHETTLDVGNFGEHAWEITRRVANAMSLVPRIQLASTKNRWQLHNEYYRRWFKILNGNQTVFDGKHQFSRIVRELGYLAPESLIVHPDQPHDDNLLGRIESLDPGSPHRFCKPFAAAGGRGIRAASSSLEAFCFVHTRPMPYLVSTFLPPVNGEWRYILHRTVDDLWGNKPPSIRIAANKLGPTLTGDGIHTVREQVIRSKQWSTQDRHKLLMTAPAIVLPEGQQHQLVNSGNISLRLFRFAMPDPAQLADVDAFMLEFLAKLEAHLDYKLATACFDFGFTADGQIVFYEHQAPFAVPYGKSFGGTSAQHRRARLDFLLSTYLSGQYCMQ
jgi:hypothetical protein